MYSIVNAVSLRARVEQTTEAAGPSEMIGRPRAEIPVMKRPARRQRISRICRSMYCALADRPEADQALAMNELIETWLPRSTRLHLRGMTYVEREGFVAVRSAIHHLRTKHWTAGNWLELRLCKYIATGVFKFGTRLFSKVQKDDGSWEQPVLVPMPSNRNRARQDQIFCALPVPSPFRRPEQIAQAQTDLLKQHDITISEDGKGANIDILFRYISRF